MVGASVAQSLLVMLAQADRDARVPTNGRGCVGILRSPMSPARRAEDVVAPPLNPSLRVSAPAAAAGNFRRASEAVPAWRHLTG